MSAIISPRPEAHSDIRPELATVSQPQRLSPVLCGICVLLFFAVLSFGAVEQWSISILEIGSALLFLTWVVPHLIVGEVNIKPNVLYRPAALFAVVVSLQLVFNLSAYRYDTTITGIEYLAYGMLLFLTAQSLANKRCSKVTIWALTLFGSALAMFAISQSLTSTDKIYWLRIPRNGGAIFGPYVNRNHYAGLMEMLSPIPIILSLSGLIRGAKRILVAFAGVVMAASIVLSQSRAGTASFLVEMTLVFGLLLGTRKKGSAAAGVGTFCVAVIALAAWIGTISLWRHFTDLQGWMRLAMLTDGLHMFGHRPIFGWGLGTFTTVYPQFRSFYTNLFVNAAHNDYLQVLVETGIVGFGAILWFVVEMYRAGLRNLDLWNRSWSCMLGFAALIGCTGILVHSAFDFNFQIPSNACMFCFLSAVATAAPSLRESIASRRPQMRKS